MLNSCVLNPKVDPLSSHSCYCALDATTSGIKGSYTPIRGLVRSVLSLPSTKFAYCKWRLNAAETWQRGYELVSFVVQYSFLHCQAGLDEAWSDDTVHPGSLLHIQGGPLHGDIWTIQAPSPCNHPPSIFGTRSGQYGIIIIYSQWAKL